MSEGDAFQARATHEPSPDGLGHSVGVPIAGDAHPGYGGCDGFGPLWTCSACTGVVGQIGGTFMDAWNGGELSADDAAARVGDFLMRRIEMSAVAGWGCSAEPRHLEDFMRQSLWFDLPGNPWRDPDLACDILGAIK